MGHGYRWIGRFEILNDSRQYTQASLFLLTYLQYNLFAKAIHSFDSNIFVVSYTSEKCKVDFHSSEMNVRKLCKLGQSASEPKKDVQRSPTL